MGTVKVTIGVGDPQGRQFEDVEVVVDTGSTYTAVPRELLQRLGVLVERSLPSETADGRLVPVDVGRTTIRLEGLEFSTPVISVAGQAKARAEGRFPGRRPSLTAQQRDYIRVERSKGVSQRELAKLLEVSRWTIQQVDR